MLCMTEKLLKSSIKQPLGVSPNTILYGDAIPTEHTLLAEIDTIPSITAPRTIRDYVNTLMARQGRIISAAISSQQKEKEHRKFWSIPCVWQIPPRLEPLQPNESLTPMLPHL